MADSERIEVLTAARLWPRMMEMLHGAYAVHDRTHQGDPAAFAKVAPRIRAIAASGESKITRELIAQLPKLEIVSVFGVGYDGVDVAAARERDTASTSARARSATSSLSTFGVCVTAMPRSRAAATSTPS